MRVFLAAMFVAATFGQARAGSMLVTNTTDTVAYSSDAGGGPVDYFGNGASAVGTGGIGGDFATTQLVLTGTRAADGGAMLDFRYTTLFAGDEAVGGAAVNYADIFLRTTASGYSAASFGYAIALGDQLGNGGLGAGLYAVSSDVTSRQVWSGRPGFIYGGQYAASGAYQPGQAGFAGYDAPVAVTGGTRLADAAVATSAQADGTTLVDVSVSLSAAQAALFAGSADVFWGTGDCANGSFLASFASLIDPAPIAPQPVPEPASGAMAGAFLLTLGLARRLRGTPNP